MDDSEDYTMNLNAEIETGDDDEVEEFFLELFRAAGPEGEVVLHRKDCDTDDGITECTCIPITLRRGAKA